MGDAVAIAGIDPFLRSCFVDLNTEECGAGHGRGQRLCPAHSAQTGRENDFSGKAPRLAPRGRGWSARSVGGMLAKMLLGAGHERFVSSLDDALTADIDPATGRHLA